eukprot:g46898.t1
MFFTSKSGQVLQQLALTRCACARSQPVPFCSVSWEPAGSLPLELAATSPHDTPSRAPTVSGRLPAGSHETLQKGTGWLLAQAHLVKASCCKTWPDLLVKNICAPLNWHSGSRVGHEDDEDNEEEGEEEEGEEEKKEGEVEEVGIDDDDEEHDEDDNNFEDDDGERKETVMALFQKPFWLQAGQAHPAM